MRKIDGSSFFFSFFLFLPLSLSLPLSLLPPNLFLCNHAFLILCRSVGLSHRFGLFDCKLVAFNQPSGYKEEATELFERKRKIGNWKIWALVEREAKALMANIVERTSIMKEKWWSLLNVADSAFDAIYPSWQVEKGTQKTQNRSIWGFLWPRHFIH